MTLRIPIALRNTSSQRVFAAPSEPLLNHWRIQLTSPTAQLSQAIVQIRHLASEISAKRRLPRNDEIRSKFVHLVGQDGKLSPPKTTFDVFNSIDRATHSLVVVALPSGNHVEADDAADERKYQDPEWKDLGGNSRDGPEYPLCKIVENKELWESSKHSTQKAKSSSSTMKTIELNWAIDQNDLKHRLDRIRDFLAKGYKVEVMMAGKRKGKKATPEQAESLLKKVKSVTDDVPGSKESRAMDGNLIITDLDGKARLGNVTVFFEGRVEN